MARGGSESWPRTAGSVLGAVVAAGLIAAAIAGVAAVYAVDCWQVSMGPAAFSSLGRACFALRDLDRPAAHGALLQLAGQQP